MNTKFNEAAEKYIPDNLIVKVEAINSKDEVNHFEEMILKCNVVEIIAKILAQLQLNNKQVGAGVWIKASERLPDKAGWYHTNQDLYDGTIYKGSAYWNGYEFNDEGIEAFEWLDETQSQPISFTEDETEKAKLIKLEERYYKELFDDLLTILNERRNKYALQGAHEWKIEGFDLAVSVVKNMKL